MFGDCIAVLCSVGSFVAWVIVRIEVFEVSRGLVGTRRDLQVHLWRKRVGRNKQMTAQDCTVTDYMIVAVRILHPDLHSFADYTAVLASAAGVGIAV